jgi:hypothetical protein
MKTSTEDWGVECKPSGQHGYVFYHEGAHELPLYWEYGGGDVIVIVRFDEPDKFALGYPWAVKRKREILERVAGELIRQQAPGCRSEIDEESLCIYVREKIAG